MGNPTGETAEDTSQQGYKFLELVKLAKDKRQKKDPKYYKANALPIAFDTIEAKLRDLQYPTLTTLESDLKRLVFNNKSYYPKNSAMWLDAERVRKITSDFMHKNNPAYRDPRYVAFPTPLPNEENIDPDHAPDRAPDHAPSEATEKSPSASPSPMRKRMRTRSPSHQSSKEAEWEPDPGPVPEPTGAKAPDISPAMAAMVAAKPSLAGKTFQAAQETIISEMIDLHNDQDEHIALPFHNLPPRKLTDYYALIKKPVSLKGIQKRVSGVHGRHEKTGVTDFKTWGAFADEMSYIWRNAREYNEESSDIVALVGQLEDYFKGRLAHAKQVVPEPTPPTRHDNTGRPRLTIKMSTPKPPAEVPTQKLKIRLGPNSSQPSARESTSGGPSAGPSGVGRPARSSGSQGPQAPLTSTGDEMTGVRSTSVTGNTNGTRARSERASSYAAPPRGTTPATTGPAQAMMPPPSGTNLPHATHGPLVQQENVQPPATQGGPGQPSTVPSVEPDTVEDLPPARLVYVSISTPDGLPKPPVDHEFPIHYRIKVPLSHPHVVQMFYVPLSQMPVTILARIAPSNNGVQSHFSVRVNGQNLNPFEPVKEGPNNTVEAKYIASLSPGINVYKLTMAVIRPGMFDRAVHKMTFVVDVLPDF
ncbi:MAG: hypothetical protein M1823_001998 [Watsoniomyces obsoletus]|nr:MAG: hypothetical protein M1823_001998 [Watsoniomyces obsoletus]